MKTVVEDRTMAMAMAMARMTMRMTRANGKDGKSARLDRNREWPTDVNDDPNPRSFVARACARYSLPNFLLHGYARSERLRSAGGQH